MLLWILQIILMAIFLEFVLNLQCVPYLESFNLIIGKLVVSLVLLKMSFIFTRRVFLNNKKINNVEEKAVLITGCDSGFGHYLAKRLDARGFRVFASCLFPDGSGAKELQSSCSKRLQILEMDITKDSHVEKAVEFVKTTIGSAELWAIVNNAGVIMGLSVELTDLDEFEKSMDINSYGLMRVTKAFLPMLRRSKGRIVNVTSPLGRLCLPYLAPYCASKHAAVGINDCLRQELEPWGVKVISVEPDAFKTALSDHRNFKKSIDYTMSRVKTNLRDDYGNDFWKTMYERLPEIMVASDKVYKVIDDLEAAITAVHPQTIYRPCRNALIHFFLNIFILLPVAYQDVIIAKLFFWFCGIEISRFC